jgi:peptidoglycan/xylan/chitin deacetylase (PgdA/CDA1 family)
MHKKMIDSKCIYKLLILAGFVVMSTGIGVLVEDVQAQNALLINEGFEEAGDTEKKAYGWHDFGCGYTRVKNHRSGDRGIRVVNLDGELCGAYQRIDLNQTELKPVAISGYVKGRDIKNSPGGYLGASLYAEIHMQDGTVAYWNSVGNYGSFGWRWIGFNTGTVSYVDQPIDHIFIVPILADATGKAFFDDMSVEEFTPSGPAVTFMFDDGEESILTEAKSELDRYGFKGSVSVITEMVNEDGFLTWSELLGLQADGWEMVSHGITHNDFTKMSIRNVQRELNRSKRQLERRGLLIKNFALPYGAYNMDILSLAAKKYSSARAYEQGMNPMGAYPFDIKVRGVLESTTPDEVASWVEQAKSEGKWIIITFHSISETGDDDYHIAPDVFSKMIDVVAESGVPTMTYDQGIQAFGLKK